MYAEGGKWIHLRDVPIRASRGRRRPHAPLPVFLLLRSLHTKVTLTPLPLRPFFQVLKFLESTLSSLHVPYPSGFAIVLLTCLVKLATLPLTKQQVRGGRCETLVHGAVL